METGTWYKNGKFATIKFEDGMMLSIVPGPYNGFDYSQWDDTPDQSPLPEIKSVGPAIMSARVELFDFHKLPN